MTEETLNERIEMLANFLDDDDEIQAEFERDMRRRANTILAESACIGHGDEQKWHSGDPFDDRPRSNESGVSPGLTVEMITRARDLMAENLGSSDREWIVFTESMDHDQMAAIYQGLRESEDLSDDRIEVRVWPTRGLHG